MDVDSLVNPSFLDAQCPRCKALLRVRDLSAKERSYRCVVCRALWKIDGSATWNALFESFDCSLAIETPIEHAQKLATIASSLRSQRIHPLSALLQLLRETKYFIHICTYSITSDLLAMAAFSAMDKPVRLVVGSSVSDYVKETANVLVKPSPQMKVIFSAENNSESAHQKVYIFDGIIGITGSANFTLAGWNKIATNKEHIEVSTNIDKVRHINNTSFSTLFRDSAFGKFEEFSLKDNERNPDEFEIWDNSPIAPSTGKVRYEGEKVALMMERLCEIHKPTFSLIVSMGSRVEHANHTLNIYLRNALITKTLESKAPQIQKAWYLVHNEFISVVVKEEEYI